MLVRAMQGGGCRAAAGRVVLAEGAGAWESRRVESRSPGVCMRDVVRSIGVGVVGMRVRSEHGVVRWSMLMRRVWVLLVCIDIDEGGD